MEFRLLQRDKDGIPDFVTKKVGILVEKENVEELANGINKILNKENEFDQEYLQNYAKNKYSQEIFMEKLIELYKEIQR